MDHDPNRPFSEEADDSGSHGPANGSPTEAWRKVARDVAEARDYAIYLLAAKIDGIKVSLRNAGIYAGLAVLGAIVAVALIVTAVVLFVSGLAGGLGVLFGNRPWLGNLVVGFLILLMVGGGAWIGISMFMKSSHRKTVRAYEDRQRRQRRQHGHDVHHRAREESV